MPEVLTASVPRSGPRPHGDRARRASRRRRWRAAGGAPSASGPGPSAAMSSPGSTLWWKHEHLRAAPGGALAKISLTRLVSERGRCPLTAMSRRFQVSEPERDAVAAERARDDRARDLQHRRELAEIPASTWRTSAARPAGRADSSTIRCRDCRESTSTGAWRPHPIEERVRRLELAVPGTLAQVAGDDRSRRPRASGGTSSSASICARSA